MLLLEQDQRGDDAHGGGDHVQSHVEGVGVVGGNRTARSWKDAILNDGRLPPPMRGRAVERSTRHETRSSDTLTRRVSSRECATQTTGGRRPAKWRLRGAVTSLPAGSNRRIPRAGTSPRVFCRACHAAHRKKSRFARNVCIRSHYFLSGQFCARGNIATDGKKLASGRRRRPRRARRVGRQRMPSPSSRGESRFSLNDGTLAAAPRAEAWAIKCASPDAARCSRTTRTSW